MSSDDSDYELDVSFNVSSGGSSGLRPKRKRKPAATEHDKLERAKSRAIEKVGIDESKVIQATFASLQTGYGQPDWP